MDGFNYFLTVAELDVWAEEQKAKLVQLGQSLSVRTPVPRCGELHNSEPEDEQSMHSVCVCAFDVCAAVVEMFSLLRYNALVMQ